ncbi:hypothetical protein SUGI_0707760 [Cryptomeria japonica]|nr:hypothetical protein SUGI_0707760 [Cryptomeria japonica]
MSSTLSSETPSQLIDKILNTNADKPDFDLGRLVTQIDVFLLHYEDQLRKKNLPPDKWGVLLCAAVACNLADEVSTNVKQIADEGVQSFLGCTTASRT